MSLASDSVAGVLCTDEDGVPKFKLGAIDGLRRWKQDAATRITEKKKKKLTLRGYSKVSLTVSTHSTQSLLACVVIIVITREHRTTLKR